MTSVWVQNFTSKHNSNLNSLDVLDKRALPLYHSSQRRNPFSYWLLGWLGDGELVAEGSI